MLVDVSVKSAPKSFCWDVCSNSTSSSRSCCGPSAFWKRWCRLAAVRSLGTPRSGYMDQRWSCWMGWFGHTERSSYQEENKIENKSFNKYSWFFPSSATSWTQISLLPLCGLVLRVGMSFSFSSLFMTSQAESLKSLSWCKMCETRSTRCS